MDLLLKLIDLQLINVGCLLQVFVLLGQHLDLVLKGFHHLRHPVKLTGHGIVLLIELLVLTNHEFYTVINSKTTYG